MKSFHYRNLYNNMRRILTLAALLLVSACGREEPTRASAVPDTPVVIELPPGQKSVAIEVYRSGHDGVVVTTRARLYYEDADTLTVWAYRPRRLMTFDGTEREYVGKRQYIIYESK